MASERLSRLQRCILHWLRARSVRTQGTMPASHQELVQALHARGYDKGNLFHSLANLAAIGLVQVTKIPGGLDRCHRLDASGVCTPDPTSSSSQKVVNKRSEDKII